MQNKTTLILLAFLCCIGSAFAQSPCPTPPAVNSPSCIVKYYNSGANCHGFVYRYLTNNYAIGSVQCGETDPAKINIIQACVNEGYRNPSSVYDLLTEVPSSSSEIVAIIYELDGQPVHSAVHIGGGNYLSKFEECGSVVRHYSDPNSPLYYVGSNWHYTIRYFKRKVPPVCTTPELTLSGCTSCSCRTSQGYFIVNAYPSGFTNYVWSVSGAAIAYNMGSYIYVNKPGGGSVGVTVTATYAACGVQKTKYQMFTFPYCTGSGYAYQMSRDEFNTSLESFRQPINFVLPENVVTTIRETATHDVVNVKIYDLQGQLYFDQNISSETPYLELTSSLKKGLYVIRVTLDKDHVLTEKIAIQE